MNIHFILQHIQSIYHNHLENSNSHLKAEKSSHVNLRVNCEAIILVHPRSLTFDLGTAKL